MRWTISITIGFLWFDLMRGALADYEEEYASLRWSESKGWLDRTYRISGSHEAVQEIYQRFYEWSSKPKIVKE